MAEQKVPNYEKLVIPFSGFAATTFVYGPADTGRSGGWCFHIFANGATFSLTAVARIKGPKAETDALPMVTVNYRSIFLNGAVSTEAFLPTAITGTSLIVVPSLGQSVGLLVASLSVANLIVYAYPVSECPAF
jgi:hypothetical protein